MPEYELKGGWLKDPYNPLSKMVGVTKALPPFVSLENYIPNAIQPDWPYGQGAIGSCVAFGQGGIFSTTAKQLGIYTEPFSRTWLYNGFRYLMGWLDRDSGAYPDKMFEWVLTNGLLLEQYWRYDYSKLDMTVPNTLHMSRAVKYKNMQVFRVVDGADGIMSAISEGHAVSFCCPWPKSWTYYPPAGVLPEITVDAPLYTGHNIFIYGYDQPNGKFLIQNSWGKNWGVNGRALMPIAAVQTFKQMGGYDAHYVTFEALPIVVTTPKISLVNDVVPVNTIAKLEYSGFLPLTELNIKWEGQWGWTHITTRSDNAGAGKANLWIQDSAGVGVYTLTVWDGTNTATIQFTVTGIYPWYQVVINAVLKFFGLRR
jgi:hypothetical protein